MRTGLICLTALVIGVAVALFILSRPTPSAREDERERAYRLNNIGVAHLEQYDYDAAAAVAMVLLGISFTMLIVVHKLQGGLAASRAGRRT